MSTVNHGEPSVASLASGIMSDVQDLLKQQLSLTRNEIRADLRNTREAVSLFAFGWAICLAGVFGLCAMVAHLLHWLGTPPQADLSSFPLWVGYAIAAFLFLLTGSLTLAAAKQKSARVSEPFQDTARALRENIEWKTKHVDQRSPA